MVAMLDAPQLSCHESSATSEIIKSRDTPHAPEAELRSAHEAQLAHEDALAPPAQRRAEAARRCLREEALGPVAGAALEAEQDHRGGGGDLGEHVEQQEVAVEEVGEDAVARDDHVRRAAAKVCGEHRRRGAGRPI
eukprot:scaffold27788_cov63-Phaeocystis_antarctica.AAC.2